MDVVVVGAGIAGVSCARRLAEGGARVRVVERGRVVVGGRLASATTAGTPTSAPPIRSLTIRISPRR